jgi:hypothetical protein
MLPSTSLAAAAVLALAGSAAAKIGNIWVPKTVAPAKGFHVIIQNINWISANEQFAVAVGQQPPGGSADSLGNLLTSFPLGPNFAQTLGNSTHTVPATTRTFTSGPGELILQVFSAYGIAWSPVVEPFAVNVTFGTKNSKEYVSVF